MPAGDLEGLIHADVLYTKEELMKRLRIKDGALRSMRRQGLPIIRIASRVFYHGQAVIDYMKGMQQVESKSS